MKKLHRHDEKPWEPTLDTLPVFNSFVSPIEHLGDPRPAFPPDEEVLEVEETATTAVAGMPDA